MTDDLLSLFIYSSSHTHVQSQQAHQIKTKQDPCSAMQWIGRSTDAEHTQASISSTRRKYQAKAAAECPTSIRQVVIAWQTKRHTRASSTHVTHKQIKQRPLKTPRKQSNPSIAYLDLLLFMMNHSFQFHGRDCYLHTWRKEEYECDLSVKADPYQVHTWHP